MDMAELNASKIDIRLAVEQLQPVDASPLMIRCPAHKSRLGVEDDKGSLAVYPRNVKCYGCDFYTSPKQVYASLALVLGLWDGSGDDYRPAMEAKKVAHKYTSGVKHTFKTVPAEIPTEGQVLGMARFLWNYKKELLVDEFVNRRGIGLSVVHSSRIGYTGSMFSIPIYGKEGQLLTVRYRRDDRLGSEDDPSGKPGPKYKGTRGVNQTFLYPEHRLQKYLDRRGGASSDNGVNGNGGGARGKFNLFVCEGEFDSLAWWSRAIPAITATNGAGQSKRIPELLCAAFGSELVDRVRFVCAMDGDARGLEARGEAGLAAKRLGFEVLSVSWPNGLKDGCEVCAKYGENVKEVLTYELQ